jgi:methylase of polypeptide subunit release factors
MSKAEKRMALYNDMNPAGRAFVDNIAAQLEDKLKERYRGRNMTHTGKVALSLGEGSARELAMALLEHTWNGELPQG